MMKQTKTNSISLYLNKIGNYPVLTSDEERMLAKKMANGCTSAKNKFINSNLRLVVSISKQYTTSEIELLDLVQEGNIGLLKAVEMFDYTKKCKFSTYATYWIKQAISRAISNKYTQIRIPENVQELINKYKSFQDVFYIQNMRKPQEAEIATDMKISIADVKEIESFIYNSVSLNTPILSESDSDAELGDFVECSELTPEEKMMLNSKTEALDLLISSSNLTDLEEKVIRTRFDLKNNQFNSEKHVAKTLKITQKRVFTIEAKALRKIKINAERKYPKEYFS